MTHTARIFLDDHDGYGWSVSSPDLPGLVGGVDSFEEACDEERNFKLAIAAGLELSGSIDTYLARVFQVGDRIFTVRAVDDFYIDQRRSGIGVAERFLNDNPDVAATLKADRLGDVTLVVCLPSDPLTHALRALVTDQPTHLLVMQANGNLRPSPSLLHQAVQETKNPFRPLGVGVDATVEDWLGADESAEDEIETLRRDPVAV